MTASRWFVAMAVALLPAARGLAQQAPPSCSQPGYRQFDFWVGTWTVTLPNGKTAGTNRITREMGGCVVHEHWSGAGGVVGESFSTYVPATKGWHQTWVDNSGTLLLLDGAAVADTMRLGAEVSDSTGATSRHEVRWYATDPRRDTVRQLWRVSRDAGATWTVIFDGRYVRSTASGGTK